MEYRGYKIEECYYGGFEAFNLNDCDAYTLFGKTEADLKAEIDEIIYLENY